MNEKSKPFIPSWLDEAGLTAAEMRVFVHLLRSADKAGVAWPSYARIISITRLSKSTIRRAIDELKRRDLIVMIGKPFAGSCRYKVLPIVPPEGQKEASNSSTREPIEPAPIVPPVTRNSPSSEPSIVPPEGQEGNPLKVIHLRVSNKEALPFSSDQFQAAWNDWKQHRIELKKKLTPTSTRQQFKTLEAMGEDRAIAAINHSIGNGWTGIFEPASTKATAGHSSKLTLDELMGGRKCVITKASDIKPTHRELKAAMEFPEPR
jgi:hypothetical protein